MPAFRTVLALPPLLVTGVFLSCYAIGIAAMNEQFPAELGLVGDIIGFLLMLVWPYALYDAVVPEARRLKEVRLAFLIGLAGMVAITAMRLSNYPIPGASIAALPTILSMLFGMWVAARALVTAEGQADPHGNRRFIAFVQLFFLPFGVWFLRPRLAAVTATH